MKYALVFFSTALLAVPALASAQLKSVATYEAMGEKAYTDTKSRWDNLAASSGENQQKYYLQYPMMAYLDFYEATGKEIYLERVLKWAETSIAAATIKDKDGFLHWAGPHSDYGVSGIAYYLWDAQGSTEIARVARLVLVDGSAAIKSKYGARAEMVANHVRKNFVQRYWSDSITGWKNQTCNPPAAEPWRAFHDKQLLAARTLLDLSLVYNDASYKKMGVDTMQCFRNRMEEWRGALVWARAHIPGDFGTGDVSHANRVARVIVDYHRKGLVFSRADVNKVAILLTDVIWNGSTSDPLFTNYVDGTNTIFRERGPYEVGAPFYGWGNLASYDCDAYRAVDATAQFIYEGKTNASTKYLIYGDKLAGLAGPLALAASSGTCGVPAGTSGGTTGGTTGGTSGGLTPGACNGYPAGSTPPTGYAASWNVLSAGKELMLSTMCRADGVDITVGTGAQNQYIYKQRYTYTAGQTWAAVPLNGTLAQGSTDWLVGKGTYSMGVPPSSFFWVAYVCQYVNNTWKCGCRDAACATPYWQLQQAVIK